MLQTAMSAPISAAHCRPARRDWRAERWRMAAISLPALLTSADRPWEVCHVEDLGTSDLFKRAEGDVGGCRTAACERTHRSWRTVRRQPRIGLSSAQSQWPRADACG